MEKKTNAIELWAENFSKKPLKNCSEKEGKNFLSYYLAEMQHTVDEQSLQKLLDDKQGGLASVFWLRVKYCHTYSVSVTVAAFFGDCLFKNFAMSTMMANYIQYWAHKLKLAKITMREVALMFPGGFPTEESWKEAWKEQKVEREENNVWSSDNGLDYPQLMESIKEIA